MSSNSKKQIRLKREWKGVFGGNKRTKKAQQGSAKQSIVQKWKDKKAAINLCSICRTPRCRPCTLCNENTDTVLADLRELKALRKEVDMWKQTKLPFRTRYGRTYKVIRKRVIPAKNAKPYCSLY